MKIRKATEKDIFKLRKLILYCINYDFGHYPKEKINAMKGYSSKDNLKKYLSAKGWETFVYLDKEKFLGTISLQDKEVTFSLYAVNEDIKKELIDFVEEKCLKNNSKRIIAIVMPENKKDFLYQKFKVVQKLILPFKKINFDEYKMEKKLK